MAFSIIETSWDEHRAELSALRERIFIGEQGVPEELEWDGADPASRHFLALDGRALLVAAEEAARAAGMREIFLYAQTHATSFYEGAGFSASGGIFMDAHIPHRQMFKLLT